MTKATRIILPPETGESIRRFAANWNVPLTEASAKMFLACAADSALWKVGREEFPDDAWFAVCRDLADQLGMEAEK